MRLQHIIYVCFQEKRCVAYHTMADLTALSQVVYISCTHTDILGELFCGEPYLFDRLY